MPNSTFCKKIYAPIFIDNKMCIHYFFCNLGTCKALQLRSVNHGCNALASADYISSCRSAPKVQNFSYGAGEENQSTRSAETLLLRLCSINTSPSAVVADETCHSFIHKLLWINDVVVWAEPCTAMSKFNNYRMLQREEPPPPETVRDRGGLQSVIMFDVLP